MKKRKVYQFRPTVRMTAEEHEKITALAEKAGLSMARYLVESALHGAAPSPEERELKRQEFLQREWSINQLVRVGNNLNQAVRKLHFMTGTVTYSNLNAILKDLSTTLGRFRNAWGRPPDDRRRKAS